MKYQVLAFFLLDITARSIDTQVNMARHLMTRSL